MRVERALPALALALVVAQCNCSCARVASSCATDDDCATGTVCRAESCVAPTDVGEGEGEGAPASKPRIDFIDGDGDALPIAIPAPSPQPPSAHRARHRIRRDVVVHGAGLDLVTAAAFDVGGVLTSASIRSRTGDHMTLTLPRILPGLVTLVLTAASGEARADVFLLQGEPGPSTLFTSRDADPSACPAGGVHYAGGVDVNRNGVLDVAEEDPALARDICNGATGATGATGDSIFDCSSGTCTSTLPLAAPAMTLNGRSAATHIDAPVTVLVPGDAPTVAAAMALFDGIALDADVDIVVTDGTAEPSAITVTRLDGLHLHITGATPGARLVFSGTSGFVVDGGRLTIAGITIQGNGTGGSFGVLAVHGGFVNFGAGVVVDSFTVTVLANQLGSISARGVTANRASNGFLAQDGGYMDATNAIATNTVVAFGADRGGIVEAPGCTATSATGSFGGLATNGGLVTMTSCKITGFVDGVDADDMGLLLDDNSATFAAITTLEEAATRNSMIRDDGTTAARTSLDTSSVIFP